MEDLKYKKICEKLGLDLRYEAIKVIDGDERPTILSRLSIEEKEYLIEKGIEPKIILVYED